MSVLELAQPVVFDTSPSSRTSRNHEQIEFMAWVDPDTTSKDCGFQEKFFLDDFSQETSFATLNFQSPQFEHYYNSSPDVSWQPIAIPALSPSSVLGEFDPFSRNATSRANTKKMLQKKSRKRKLITKRTDFDKGTRSKSETGFRGVRFSTNGCRFRATVNVNKKPLNVGTFDTAKVAAEEYDRALIKVTHGRVERSRLNFPNRWTSLYQQVRQAHSKTYTQVDTIERATKRQKLAHW